MRMSTSLPIFSVHLLTWMSLDALGVSDSKGKRKPTMEAAAGSASVPSKRKRRTSERERVRTGRESTSLYCLR